MAKWFLGLWAGFSAAAFLLLHTVLRSDSGLGFVALTLLTTAALAASAAAAIHQAQTLKELQWRVDLMQKKLDKIKDHPTNRDG